MVKTVLLVFAIIVLSKGIVQFLLPQWRRWTIEVWLESPAVVRSSGVLSVLMAVGVWWVGRAATGAAQATLVVLAVWCLMWSLAFLVCPRPWITSVRGWIERATEQQWRRVTVGFGSFACLVAAWLFWVAFGA